MRSKFKSIITCVVISLVMLSCKKENDAPLPVYNQWILDSMRVYYYWADELPERPADNTNATSFFKGLLNKADRFSYIEAPDNPPTGYSSFAYYGFEYALVRPDALAGKLVGTITLVVPGGPAHRNGLKRGEVFLAVNDIEVNSGNADKINTILKQGGNIELKTAELNNGKLYNQQQVSVSYSYFREQPVYITKTFCNGTKKTGYIFYNQFAGEFDRNILDSLVKLKNNGITDLIIDVRYNPGGDVASAAKLGAAIAPVKSDQVFIINQANRNGGRIADNFGQSIARSGYAPATFSAVAAYHTPVQKLYVLTSKATASAAELLINNLRPYMPVVHIGGNTMGKDMASFAIYDQRSPKKAPYTLHPLIFKLYNASNQGDYGNGLTPDHPVDEFSALPLKAFGSNDDPLLATALHLSLGQHITAREGKLTTTDVHMGGQPLHQSTLNRSELMPPAEINNYKNFKKQ